MTFIPPLPPERQYLLSPERQLTLDGVREPLLDTPVQQAPEPEPQSDSRQHWLLDPDTQLPLPMQTRHEPVDGKPPMECYEGKWRGSVCPDHPDTASVNPCVCGHSACLSSAEANSRERARDAWDGHRDIGLRHFGNVPWGILTTTVPEELRPLLATKEGSRRYRECHAELVNELLCKHAGRDDLDFYTRTWFHPVGDSDERKYHPHDNTIVPLVGRNQWGKSVRLRRMLPKDWLGQGGWVQRRWAEILVEEFGCWWGSGEPPASTNWFWEYREEEGKKKHALRYFARVFPGWTDHPLVNTRPRTGGLANPRNVERLKGLLSDLDKRALKDWGACPQSTVSCPCPDAVSVEGGSAEEVLELLRSAAYVQYRRMVPRPEPESEPPKWQSDHSGRVLSRMKWLPPAEWFLPRA